MNAEIICVGTELLLGNILNTNAKYLSCKLSQLGINVFSQSVVGDNKQRLVRQLTDSVSKNDIVILSGGLGPTEDDITKECVAQVLDRTLVEDKKILKSIENYFKRAGRDMSKNNKKQAMTISGSTVLKNKNGTAPGYIVESENTVVILLPGPPKELIPMFEEYVYPYLAKKSNKTIISHNVRIFGIGESKAAEVCSNLVDLKNPTVATYASTGEVNIRVTARAETAEKAEKMCTPVIDELKRLFGDNIYGIDCDNIQQVVVNKLIEKKMRIATAESCTAGLLSSRITDVAGSSEVFEMGVTAYANYIKIQALGVDENLIKEKGAVDPLVAAEMAVGIQKMCDSDIGVGITGVAGPGESEGKPAGLVYVAVSDRENVFVRKIMCSSSSRENTRTIAASTALDMVRRYLFGSEDFIKNKTAIGNTPFIMQGYELPNVSPKKIEDFNTLDEAPKSVVKRGKMISDKELAKLYNAVAEDNGADENPVMKLDYDDGNENISYVFEDEGSDNKRYSESFIRTKEDDTMLSVLADDENIAEDLNNQNGKDNNGKAKKQGIIHNLFPTKNDSTSEKLRKILFMVSFVVLIVTMVYLINYFAESWFNSRLLSSAATEFESDDSMKKNADGIFVKFEGLLKKNPDIKGWIKINGTNINYPVVQAANNNYYLKHNFEKQESRYGSLFVDYSDKIKKNETSKNIVIYGHHMKDGTMFGSLKNYTQLQYYKEHSIIDFTSLYNAGTYKIFSVFITNSSPSDDNGIIYNYRDPDFRSDKEFLQWLESAKIRSIIDTGVDVNAQDEILTLSTCTYEFNDARLVVMARRIRTIETTNIYSTADAKLNETPLYPQIWYDKKGLKKPDIFTSSKISSQNLSENSSTASSNNVIGSTSSASSSSNSTKTSASRSSVTTNRNAASAGTRNNKSSSAKSTSSVPSTSVAISSTATEKPSGASSASSKPAPIPSNNTSTVATSSGS